MKTLHEERTQPPPKNVKKAKINLEIHLNLEATSLNCVVACG